MKRIAARAQSDPIGLVLAAVLLLALIAELISFRTPLVEFVFGLALGLVIGYNVRLVVEKSRT